MERLEKRIETIDGETVTIEKIRVFDHESIPSRKLNELANKGLIKEYTVKQEIWRTLIIVWKGVIP